MKRLFMTIAISASLSANADTFTDHPVLGGTAMIKLPYTVSGHPDLPKVTYYGDLTGLTIQDDQWYTVVGLPFDGKPGPDEIKLEDGSLHSFTVKPSDRAVESLPVINAPKTGGKSSDEIVARITKDRETNKAALSTRSNTFYGHQFQYPLDDVPRVTSTFTFRHRAGIRQESGKITPVKDRQHQGIDLARSKCNVYPDVLAASSGKVIVAENQHFLGNVVIIDHGLGVLSLYAHMDNIKVSVGDEIKGGTVIGKMGNTGIGVGPHLHWGVYVNGRSVDGSILIKDEYESGNKYGSCR